MFIEKKFIAYSPLATDLPPASLARSPSGPWSAGATTAAARPPCPSLSSVAVSSQLGRRPDPLSEGWIRCGHGHGSCCCVIQSMRRGDWDEGRGGDPPACGCRGVWRARGATLGRRRPRSGAPMRLGRGGGRARGPKGDARGEEGRRVPLPTGRRHRGGCNGEEAAEASGAPDRLGCGGRGRGEEDSVARQQVFVFLLLSFQAFSDHIPCLHNHNAMNMRDGIIGRAV